MNLCLVSSSFSLQTFISRITLTSSITSTNRLQMSVCFWSHQEVLKVPITTRCHKQYVYRCNSIIYANTVGCHIRELNVHIHNIDFTTKGIFHIQMSQRWWTAGLSAPSLTQCEIRTLCSLSNVSQVNLRQFRVMCLWSQILIAVSLVLSVVHLLSLSCEGYCRLTCRTWHIY